MIICETPVKTLKDELDRLSQIAGPNSKLYAKGAIDAIRWILDGLPPPTKSHFLSDVRET